LSASHPFTWRFVGAHVLEFRFDPIYLPDSTSNEPESHGFVAFTAKLKPGMGVGAVVSNRAGIYFDYNEPVITEYAVLQVVAVSTGEPGNVRLDLRIAPNPAPAYTDIRVGLPELPERITVRLFTETGRQVRHVQVEKDARQVQLEGLPAGVYTVQVQSGKLSGSGVLIVH
jgi:hypothetical protein